MVQLWRQQGRTCLPACQIQRLSRPRNLMYGRVESGSLSQYSFLHGFAWNIFTLDQARPDRGEKYINTKEGVDSMDTQAMRFNYLLTMSDNIHASQKNFQCVLSAKLPKCKSHFRSWLVGHIPPLSTTGHLIVLESSGVVASIPSIIVIKRQSLERDAVRHVARGDLGTGEVGPHTPATVVDSRARH